MVDVVSLMAGRYLEGGGGEVARWPQLNQREGGEKVPLLVSTTLARRARVEMPPATKEYEDDEKPSEDGCFGRSHFDPLT